MNIRSISFIMNICSISKFYFIYDRAFQLKKMMNFDTDLIFIKCYKIEFSYFKDVYFARNKYNTQYKFYK